MDDLWANVCTGCGMGYHLDGFEPGEQVFYLCDDCKQRRLREIEWETRRRIAHPEPGEAVLEPGEEFERALGYWQDAWSSWLDIGGEAGGA